MLEIIQATSYFSYYPSDTCLIKALVGLLLIIDAISTLASYAGVYLVRCAQLLVLNRH